MVKEKRRSTTGCPHKKKKIDRKHVKNTLFASNIKKAGFSMFVSRIYFALKDHHTAQDFSIKIVAK